MTFTRTLSAASPVSLADAKAHLRVMHDDEDLTIQRLILAAAREMEACCDLALTRQTISLTALPDHGTVALPIGPLAPEAEVTVNGLPLIGTIGAGRWPVLTLDDWADGPVTVTYEAGFGDTAASVPDDLQLAVLEQAAWHYDNRGSMDAKPGLVPAAARIAARYKRVRL